MAESGDFCTSFDLFASQTDLFTIQPNTQPHAFKPRAAGLASNILGLMQRQGKVVINTREIRGRIYFTLQNVVCKDSGVGGNDCDKHERQKDNANQEDLSKDNDGNQGPVTNAGKMENPIFLIKYPMLANKVQVSTIVVRHAFRVSFLLPLSNHISSPPCSLPQHAAAPSRGSRVLLLVRA